MFYINFLFLLILQSGGLFALLVDFVSLIRGLSMGQLVDGVVMRTMEGTGIPAVC